MRYNTGSRIAYFYGPTHIYGKKTGKDNDTLYTENGTYNTVTEQAFFGKKNLYSQGTKTLKGDSMFYDRKKGYGRVVKNITFNDNEQKMTMKGDLGTYYKADERTVVTENAYAIIVTEEKDTTKNDSVPAKPLKPGDGKKILDDTTKGPRGKTVALQNKQKPVVKPEVKAKSPDNPVLAMPAPKLRQDTTNIKKENKTNTKNKPADIPAVKKDTATRIKHDSVYMTADTLETRILTFKDLNTLQEKIRLSHIKDTTIRPPSIVYTKPVKFIELSAPKWIMDTTYLHRNMFGSPKPKAVAVQKKPEKPLAPPKKLTKQDSLKIKQDSIKLANKIDSVYFNRKIVLSDTARVRILSAFHNVKLFKSDLQGKSDSSFYSTSDSTIRLYVQPIIWTQGSQLSGDTIYLHMRNKKFENMEAFPNAFTVNIEKADSTHFNQAAGKKMRGFFSNDKLERLYIDGNAETIYFARDSGKISGMQRSLSSRIKINFKDSKATRLVFSAKPEHRYGPLEKFTDEEKILKGFIWKPKERPVSKESIINFSRRPKVKTDKGKPPATAKKDTVKKPPGATAVKDTSGTKPGNLTTPTIKTGKDTSATKPGNLQVPVIKAGKDTSAVKPGNQVIPSVKTAKDSTLTVPVKKPQDMKTAGIDSTATVKPAIKQ